MSTDLHQGEAMMSMDGGVQTLSVGGMGVRHYPPLAIAQAANHSMAYLLSVLRGSPPVPNTVLHGAPNSNDTAPTTYQ